MCDDGTMSYWQIFRMFESKFVKPHAFPNPSGSKQLGKKGPKFDMREQMIMRRSYVETCEDYESYAAGTTCKMAPSTCLSLFSPGGYLDNYGYDSKHTCLCDLCHRAEHVHMVKQLTDEHGGNFDSLRKLAHQIPGLFTVDHALYADPMGYSKPPSPHLAHGGLPAADQGAQSDTVVIFDLNGPLFANRRGPGGELTSVTANPAMNSVLAELNRQRVRWGVWTCGTQLQVDLRKLNAGGDNVVSQAAFFLGSDLCDEVFGEVSHGRTLQTKDLARAAAELKVPREKLLLVEDEPDKCRTGGPNTRRRDCHSTAPHPLPLEDGEQQMADGD